MFYLHDRGRKVIGDRGCDDTTKRFTESGRNGDGADTACRVSEHVQGLGESGRHLVRIGVPKLLLHFRGDKSFPPVSYDCS